MAGVTVHIDTKPLRALFARIQQVFKNPRKVVLEPLAQLLFDSSRKAFQAQASPEGVPWKPLSPAYAQRKAKLFPGRPILQRRLNLFRGIHSGVLPDDRGAFVSTSNLPYAAIHQVGGRAGRRHAAQIPARPYLPAVATAERLAKEVMEDALEAATKEKR